MDRSYIALQRAVDMAELRTGCSGVPLSVLEASFGLGFAEKYPDTGFASLQEYLVGNPKRFRLHAGRVWVLKQWEHAGAIPSSELDAVMVEGFHSGITDAVRNSLARLSFHEAVALGVEGVTLVLQRGMHTVDERDASLRTPLMLADSLAVATLLRGHRADHTLQDENGWTAVSHASHNGHTDILLFLSHQGANVCHRSHNGDTPLFLAAQAGQEECVDALLGKVLGKSDLCSRAVMSQNGSGLACLHAAAMARSPKCISRLAEAVEGDAFCLQCDDGNTALHIGCAYDADIVATLVAHGPEAVKVRNAKGETPLHVAVRHAQAGCVTALGNCDAGAPDNEGKTPLHDAAEQGLAEILNTLTQNSTASVDVQDMLGYTPLHYACKEGRASCVSVLLEHSCDYTVPMASSLYTPIHVAAAHGQREVLEVLLKAEPSMVHLRAQHTGMTPLHAACLSNDVAGIRVLLDHAASCNDLTHEGESGIHLVAVNPTVESVQCVIATENLTSTTLRATNNSGMNLHAILCNALLASETGSGLVDRGEIERCVELINIRTQELMMGEESAARVLEVLKEEETSVELQKSMQFEFDARALEEELDGYMELRTFTYDQLRLPQSAFDADSINIYLREFYLSDTDFEALFETDKESYRLWPQHKKEVRKKELFLLDEAM